MMFGQNLRRVAWINRSSLEFAVMIQSTRRVRTSITHSTMHIQQCSIKSSRFLLKGHNGH